MESRAKIAQVTCSICSKVFLNQTEMDEHTKREHVLQKEPAGVS